MPSMLCPDWPVPVGIQSGTTLRSGGVSRGPHASLNLGVRCGDDPAAVAENRRRLDAYVGHPVAWLDQVHGVAVRTDDDPRAEADAVVTREPGRVCAVLTADCLPVLLCSERGDAVGAVHAGWRGLVAGVLERAVEAIDAPPGELLAWLGPAIGPAAFEIGPEVRDAFLAADAGCKDAFVAGQGDRWFANLYGLARRRLGAAGVGRVLGGDACTVTDASRFFSYRRDGATGRMATWIVISGQARSR